jgi:molybdopterin molybdotransferase
MTTEPFKPHAPSCASDHDTEALAPNEAIERILSSVSPVAGFEKIAVRSALGRVLARDIESTLNVPPHANSAMDGYAVRGADLPSEGTQELKVLGTAWAGRPFAGSVHPGECARIMTGAPIPEGADTVIMQEFVERQGDFIRVEKGHKPGENVRPAGEDIALGETVLRAGRRLTPSDLGLAASLGLGEVLVKRRLRVAFFSTGDELRSIGEPLSEGAIYDSNRYTLYGMLVRLGAEVIDMGVVKDIREDLEAAFKAAAECADVLITSGGVSVGEADFVTESLEAVGTVHFWKVAMKPGRPVAFGRVGNAIFFGLPGNPVSVMATFYQFVQPPLRKMMGETEIFPLTIKAKLLGHLKKKQGRVEYQRGILGHDETGQLTVRGTGPQSSAMLTSMSEADGFIVLPMDWGRVEADTLVDVQPFYGLV